MSEPRLFSRKNPWVWGSVGVVGAIAVIAILIGFVWMPYSQSKKGESLWTFICRATGTPLSAGPTLIPTTPPARPTNVIVTAQTMKNSNAQESIGRGGTLALRCSMCHSTQGKPPLAQSTIPNLAGQNSLAIYKQLRDYKSGHRVSAIMQPMVEGLTDQDMRDLASYYASLPIIRHGGTQAVNAPAIVENGAPMRNIGACTTCHGEVATKAGAPYLLGQPQAYLRTQLMNFANGTRRNDINEQMRNVARNMTPAEIDLAVQYYSSQ